MAKKPEPLPKPGKYDDVVRATRQEYSHCHSARIISRRSLLIFEGEQLEKELIGLQSALERAKERRNRVNAMIVGLNLVLERR